MATLRERISAAAQTLVRGPAEQRDVSTAGGQLMAGVLPAGGEPPPRNAADYLEAYKNMPWLRAVLGRIGYDVAAVEWFLSVQRKDGRAVRNRVLQRAAPTQRRKAMLALAAAGELEEITDHVLLDLLHDANPMHTGLEVRRITQVHLDSVGESFWLLERNKLDVPAFTWPLPPSWVKATPTPSVPFYRVESGQWNTQIPASEMMWFLDADPANPYGRGTGVARALADELETDEYAAKTVKSVFFNRARPDLIVFPKGDETMNEDNVRRLQNDWNAHNRGFFRQFRTYFLKKAVEVKEIDTNFRTLELTKIREFERETILQVFGVSPEILGIIKPGSSRATITTADSIYARRVLVPRLEVLRTLMQARLVPQYDERLILDYVSPVREDEEQQLLAAKTAPWALTQDEWRARQGADPVPDDAGQVFLVPTNLQPVSSLSEVPPPPPKERGVRADRKAGLGSHEPRSDSHAPPPALDVNPHTELERSRQALEINKTLLAFIEAEDHEGASDWVELQKQAMDGDPPAVKLGDRLWPAYRDAQEAAWQALTADLGDVTAAITRNQPEEVLAAFGGERALAEALVSVVEEQGKEGFFEGAQFALDTLPPKKAKQDPPGLEIVLNDVNPEATAWAERESAILLKDLGPKTIRTIQTFIAASNALGIPPRKIAQALIEGNLIALNPRQMDALTALGKRLGEQGVTGTALEARLARYAEAQLRFRAMMIARTETMSALNKGQLALWKLAKQRGLIDSDMLKEWIVTWDSRLEPDCMELAGEQVPIDEDFSAGVDGPPLHTLCRCTFGLTRKPPVPFVDDPSLIP